MNRCSPLNAFARPPFFTATLDLSEKFKKSDVAITEHTLINLQHFTEADI